MGGIEGAIGTFFVGRKKYKREIPNVVKRQWSPWGHGYSNDSLGKLLQKIRFNYSTLTLYEGEHQDGGTNIVVADPEGGTYYEVQPKHLDENIIQRDVVGYKLIQNKTDEWNTFSRRLKELFPTPEFLCTTPERYPILYVYLRPQKQAERSTQTT